MTPQWRLIWFRYKSQWMKLLTICGISGLNKIIPKSHKFSWLAITFSKHFQILTVNILKINHVMLCVRKMATHTSKTLQHLLQGLEHVFDHFVDTSCYRVNSMVPNISKVFCFRQITDQEVLKTTDFFPMFYLLTPSS